MDETEFYIDGTPKKDGNKEKIVEVLDKCTTDKQKSNEKGLTQFKQKKQRRSCEGKDLDDIIAKTINREDGSQINTTNDSKEVVQKRNQNKDTSEKICSTDDLNVDYNRRSRDNSLPEKDIRRRSTGETSQKKLRRRSQKNTKKKLHDEQQDSDKCGKNKTKALQESIVIEESKTAQKTIVNIKGTLDPAKHINSPVKPSLKKTKAVKKENKNNLDNAEVSNEKIEIINVEVETTQNNTVATSLTIQNTHEVDPNNEFEIEKELEKQSKDYETESAKIISESIQEGQVIDLKPCQQNPNIIQELYSASHEDTIDPIEKSENLNTKLDDTPKESKEIHKNMESSQIKLGVTQGNLENTQEKSESSQKTTEALTNIVEAKPKRMTLPIIYKNKSAQEMYQRKTFSVKVSEEKMNLRRQEKIKSPTPEPIINQNNSEITIIRPAIENPCDKHEINTKISEEANNDPKEGMQDPESTTKEGETLLESELLKENTKEIIEENYITDEQEANEELTEDNYIKAVCEKRSQIKILENVAQGIANSKSKQIENIREQSKNVDEEIESLEKEMKNIDVERKKLIERQEQILKKCKENKGKILKLNENQMKIEEEKSIQLMSNKREMSVQQQKLLVLITMKPVAMNVANEKVFIPKLTLLDIYNRRIEAKEKEVECPMCLVPASVPIYMCEDHHLICSGCIHKVQENYF